jgi:hypothetical protein
MASGVFRDIAKYWASFGLELEFGFGLALVPWLGLGLYLGL